MWFVVHDGKSLAFSARLIPADKSILDPSEEYKLLWPIRCKCHECQSLAETDPRNMKNKT